MNFTALALPIFELSTANYHLLDDVDATIQNPHPQKSIEYYLYLKNWIDAVQWHLEDIIRDPQIDPIKALEIKRRIDKSNQDRTDLVELIDSYFLDQFKDIEPAKSPKLNTESPSWAMDRLSILVLKIYHMQQEVDREEASESHKKACKEKLSVLLEQRKDLTTAIDQVLEDFKTGSKCMKVYKQMKMYNDPSLNPVLYSKK